MSTPVESELYEILEVSITATQEEIKKSFRKQALQHHPDKGGDEAHYKKIQEAVSGERSIRRQFGARWEGIPGL
jgi:curved DNA-binding protein CbpA